MTYTYLCDHCLTENDVIKSVKDLDNVEFCEACRATMRLGVPKSVNMAIGPAIESQFFYPTGEVIHNKRDRDNSLAKLRGETGREFIEVGNDRAGFKKIKPKAKEYSTEEAVNLYHEAAKRG